MKTTLLILFLACCGLHAQTPAGGTNTDAERAARDAMLRARLREAMAGATNADTVPVIPAAIPVPSNNTPAVAAQPGIQPVAPPVTTNTVTRTTTAVVPVPVPVVSTPAVPTPAVPEPIPTIPVIPVPAPTAPPTAAVPVIAQPIPQQPALVPTVAAVPQPEETIIKAGQIDFPDVDLPSFLKFYAGLVKRTILQGPNLPQARIILRAQTDLTQKEAIEAFDTLLAMNNITMVKVGDKFVKAVPTGQVGVEGQEFTFSTASSEAELSDLDQYVNYVVQLKHVKPSEMTQVIAPLAKLPQNMMAIDSSMMLIIRDYSANVKRMLELINKVDVIVPLEYDSEMIPIRYAKVGEMANALSSLGGSVTASVGRGSSTGLGGVGGISGPRGGLGAGGYTGTGSLNTGFNPQGAINPTGARGAGAAGAPGASFTQRLQSLVGGGGAGAGDFQILGRTKIVSDERSNSLLVFANKQDMAMVKKIIGQLDVVLAQVLIEAIIMEVSLDDTRNLGVSYLQTSPSRPGNYFTGIGAINNGGFLNANNFTAAGSNGIGGLPGGFSYAANFGNDFQATLTALATDTRINVLSRPRVQTSHAVQATIEVGDNVPMVTGTYFGGINASASSQYQQTFVGISLSVLPLINSEGLVVMDIVQNIEQLGNPTIIDGNPVPTSSHRAANATVSVRDGDTIILGGFISTSKLRTKSGVPFLKDIPGLGYLFRSTGDSTKRVELIVLIRPTVLPTPEAAAIAAMHERDRLPGVKAAEAEHRKDENKRLKEADRIKLPDERK